MQNSTRRKLLPREDVREAILEATDRFLARYGYKKMTIDDIAQEVGIGKGSVYLFFSSKEEIALSHIDKIVEQIKEKLKEIAKKDEPGGNRLKEMLTQRVLIRFDRVQHYTQSLNDLLAALRPQLLARRKTYFLEEAQIFAEVIKEGQQKKEFAKGNPLDIAETFLAATNSLLPYSLSVHELGARDVIKKKTERIADLLLKGLISR
jgi:AcrR family transcriptional regulator